MRLRAAKQESEHSVKFSVLRHGATFITVPYSEWSPTKNTVWMKCWVLEGEPKKLELKMGCIYAVSEQSKKVYPVDGELVWSLKGERDD